MAADPGFPYFHEHVGFHTVSGTLPPEPVVAEALSELGQYLSDQFALREFLSLPRRAPTSLASRACVVEGLPDSV